MTNRELAKLDDAFEKLLTNLIISYLKFCHFEEYKIRFDTGEKIKEIYEVNIKRVKSAENGG